jgi:predicted nucleic acid-binding protein
VGAHYCRNLCGLVGRGILVFFTTVLFEESGKSREILHSAVIDALCALAKHQKIYFLWRPYLRDPNDEMVLELAVAARCDSIVTYNQRHFSGAEKFGIRVMDARMFLQEIGELP